MAIEWAIPIASAVIGAVSGAISGSYFAIRNHRGQRVWDLRAEAYASIFSALGGMRDWYELHLDDYRLDRETTAAQIEARRKQIEANERALAVVLDRHVWLLPERTRMAVREMKRELAKRNDTWFDDIHFCLNVIAVAIKVLSEYAQKDLGILPR